MKRIPQLFIALLIIPAPLFAGPSGSKITTEGFDRCTVIKVIDGDTLVLSNGEKARLIGIDTPESTDDPKLLGDTVKSGKDSKEIAMMGKEAADFTRKLIEGKQVRLEYDVTQSDPYGSLLVYVYDTETYRGMVDVLSPAGYEIVNGNEIFVNATLVKSGYAFPMTVPPNSKYAELFQKLYREAKEAHRGSWKVDDGIKKKQEAQKIEMH